MPIDNITNPTKIFNQQFVAYQHAIQDCYETHLALSRSKLDLASAKLTLGLTESSVVLDDADTLSRVNSAGNMERQKERRALILASHPHTENLRSTVQGLERTVAHLEAEYEQRREQVRFCRLSIEAEIRGQE